MLNSIRIKRTQQQQWWWKKKVAPNEPKQMLSITICNNIPRSTSIKTISQLITLLGRVFVSVSVSVHYANIYALLKPYASLPLAICLIIFLLLFLLSAFQCCCCLFFIIFCIFVSLVEAFFLSLSCYSLEIFLRYCWLCFRVNAICSSC